MRAINHFTIKGMETVSISDKLKIEHEGELELLSKLLKVEDFFVSVAKVCQKAGLNPSKVEIGKSVSEVIHFLKRAKVSCINIQLWNLSTRSSQFLALW